MKITGKAVANLLVVLAIGAVAVGWIVLGLTHFDPFNPPATMRVDMASSGGALPGAEVDYLGVPIGKIASARLLPSSLELTLSVHPKGPMPRALRAAVRQKDALGEPYIDLAPLHPGAPPGRIDGATIPVADTSVPSSLDNLLRATNAMFADISPADLSTLTQGASGIAGHATDLRTVLSSGADIGTALASQEANLTSLLASSASLTAALDAHNADLASAVSGGARLSQVLADRTQQLLDILREGTAVGIAGSAIVQQTQAAVPGVLAGLDTTASVLADRPTDVREIMQLTPQFVSDLSHTFHDGASWSSVGGLPTLPYQPTYAIPLEGSGLRIDRLFLPSLAKQITLDFQGQTSSAALLALTPAQVDQMRRGLTAAQAADEQLRQLARVVGAP